MNSVLELFGVFTASDRKNWTRVVQERRCPFLERLCLKNRKSQPDVLIGTCTVSYGTSSNPLIICPHRLLERRQIFTDCLPLLTLHEPGNEYHVVPEMAVPGGSVDYALASVRKGKVKDFLGIELQALDTTGTVWPSRQRFLHSVSVKVAARDRKSKRSFGINWKMTAKTTLLQLHHKVETFEMLGRHLVLVLQQPLLEYIRRNFAARHVTGCRIGDSMHFHAYDLAHAGDAMRLEMTDKLSTDAAGVGRLLGMQVSAKVELSEIVSLLESKISRDTLLAFGPVSDVTPVTGPS